MQYLKLKINNSFTGSTEIEQEYKSDLVLYNNYYSHTTNPNKTIVNENNVRSFLDDENNEKLVNDFVEYVQYNSSQEEFKEIFYNNKKLASVFNSFYDNNPDIFLNNESEKIVKSDIDKNSIKAQKKESDESYYIYLKVDWTKKIIEDVDFSEYTKDCVKKNYNYKKIYTEKKLEKSEHIVNYDYIELFKDKNNIGFAPIDESIVFIPDDVYLNITKDGLYQFESISQFESFFNIGLNPLTNSLTGMAISTQVISVSNHHPTLNYNFIQQGLIQINGQTNITNRIEFNTGVPQGTLGDKNALYYVQFEPYSDVAFGTDFILNTNNPSATKFDIYYPYISNSVTFIFNSSISPSINPGTKIILSLRSKRDANEVVSFLILKIEEFFVFNSYTESVILKEKELTLPKLILNCYVDYNFNDNESEFFENPFGVFTR